MINILPTDCLDIINSYILNKNYSKDLCISYFKVMFDMELMYSYSTWRYKPYCEDYSYYWTQREDIVNIVNNIIIF